MPPDNDLPPPRNVSREPGDEQVLVTSEFDATELPSSYGPTHPLYQVGSTVGSVAVCSIAVMELLLGMLAVVVLGPLVASVFGRLDEPLPRLTGWVLAVPPIVTFVLLLLLMIALVVKEWVMANKVLTLAINVVFVLASLVWIPLLVMALYSPVVALTRSAVEQAGS